MSSSFLEVPCSVEHSIFSTPTPKITDHPAGQVDIAIAVDGIGATCLRTDKLISPAETPPPEYAECVPLLFERLPEHEDNSPKGLADGEGSPPKKVASERFISEGPPSYMESVKFSSKKKVHGGSSSARSNALSQEPADDGKSCATLLGCLACAAAVPFVFAVVKLIEAFADAAP